MQDSQISLKRMNTKMLEKTAFLQCESLSRRRDILMFRSSSWYMYYYSTRMHLNRSFCTVVFWSFLQNFLGTLLLQKTSCELVFKGEFYKKWQTNILIIIKRYREVDSSFQKQTLRGKVHISEPLIESWHWNFQLFHRYFFSKLCDWNILWLLLSSGKKLGVF